MKLNRISVILFTMASIAWLISAALNALNGKSFVLGIALSVTFAAVGFVYWKTDSTRDTSDIDVGGADDE